jgi:hypothetical protein
VALMPVRAIALAGEPIAGKQGKSASAHARDD